MLNILICTMFRTIFGRLVWRTRCKYTACRYTRLLDLLELHVFTCILYAAHNCSTRKHDLFRLDFAWHPSIRQSASACIRHRNDHQRRPVVGMPSAILCFFFFLIAWTRLVEVRISKYIYVCIKDRKNYVGEKNYNLVNHSTVWAARV